MADMSSMQWRAWKTQLAPLLYDWLMHHKLVWPSQACRWGPLLEDMPFKMRQCIYLSEQTNPEEYDEEPPKLLVYEAELLKPRVASSEVVTTWAELGRCPHISEVKTIVHPGEVNKIRELPQHPSIVVTHTDAAELYVWNTITQPNMARKKANAQWGESVPDMTLIGHEDVAMFPLATASTQPMVASGGQDKLVLLWDLTDATKQGCVLEPQQVVMEEGRAQDLERAPDKTTELKPRQRLSGHSDTVEDVVFKPGSHTRLASVGDDKQVLFWDTSAGNKPVSRISGAHGTGPDVHCVDWSGLQQHLVVTGAADGSLRVWDTRKLPSGSTAAAASTAVHVFSHHKAAIMRVEWHNKEAGWLASGGEDNLVCIWHLSGTPAAAGGGGSNSKGSGRGAAAAAASSSGARQEPPAELVFKHVGHKGGKVVDFQWCPHDPWLMMSIDTGGGDGGEAEEDEGSDAETSRRLGGGTLQIWRMLDLLHMPQEQALAELESHREWILNGRQPPELEHVQQQLREEAEGEGDGEGDAAAGGGGGADSGGQQTEGGAGQSSRRTDGGGGSAEEGDAEQDDVEMEG